MSLHMVHFWQERTKAAYGDVVRLEAEVAELKAEVARLRSSSFTTAVPSEDYEKLQAEVERLRKAGDEMYMTLVDNNSHFEEVWRDKRIYAREAFQGWNHAKEGKPSV